jgi:hypothetical protein
VADAAHVVVAEERRQLVRVGVRVGVPVVTGKERGQLPGRLAAGGEIAGGVLEGEVEDGLHPVGCGEVRGEALRRVEDLAEHEELGLALLAGEVEHLWAEPLPELVVDVLHRVDAEAVHAEVPDPRLVDLDHAVDDAWVLREQVVEAEEVAVVGVLPDERRVAAVVVERDVVEPRGDLEVLLGRVEHRRVRERHSGTQRRERRAAGVVPVVERHAGCRPVRGHVLGDVAAPGALGVADHVRGVVGDDVEVDLHTSHVGGVDQGPKVLVVAEVWVDLGEVGDPVAVVARGRSVLELHGLVLEARGQPDGRGAEATDVVDLGQQTLQVTPVVEALSGRVETRHQRIRAEATLVVAGVSIGESIGHHEVERLVGHRRPERVERRQPSLAPVRGRG